MASNAQEFESMFAKLNPHTPIIHIDIGDGIFITNILVGLEEVTKSKDMAFQAHLMVEKPEEVINKWSQLLNVESIVFHIEATDKVEEIIKTVHSAGKQVGIAINLETKSDLLEPFLANIDFIQFMAVHPGQYGAEFQPEVIEKITKFHEQYPEVVISVDGGENPSRTLGFIESGATTIISGSYVMDSEDPAKAIGELKQSTI